MQNEIILKGLKILAYFVGFPLLSILMFVTFINMYSTVYLAEFAIIWTIVTLAIWAFVSIIHYIVSVTLSMKCDNVKKLGELIVLVVAVMTMLIPTVIYDAVKKNEYNKIVMQAKDMGVSLLTFDKLGGWYFSFSEGASQIDMTNQKIIDYMSDYQIDVWNTDLLGSESDNDLGIGYLPGVQDSLIDERNKKKSAQKVYDDLVAKRQAKVDELDGFERQAILDLKISVDDFATGDNIEYISTLNQLREKMLKAQSNMDLEYENVADEHFLDEQLKRLYTSVNDYAKKGFLSSGKLVQLDKEIKRVMELAESVYTDAELVLPSLDTDESEKKRIEDILDVLLSEQINIIIAIDEMLADITNQEKVDVFKKLSDKIIRQSYDDFAMISRMKTYFTSFEERMSKAVNIEDKKVLANEVLSKGDAVTQYLGIYNSTMGFHLQKANEIANDIKKRSDNYEADMNDFNELESIYEDLNMKYETEISKDSEYFLEFDGVSLNGISLKEAVRAILGMFAIDIDKIDEERKIEVPNIYKTVIDDLLMNIPLIGGELLNFENVNNILNFVYKLVTNDKNAIAQTLINGLEMQELQSIIEPVIIKLLSDWEKYTTYAMSEFLPDEVEQKTDSEKRPLFDENGDSILVAKTSKIPNMIYTLMTAVSKNLHPDAGGIVVSTLYEMLPEFITSKTSAGSIELAEQELNKGYSMQQLSQLQYELTYYPEILAFSNFKHLIYIFSGVVVIAILTVSWLTKKQKFLLEPNEEV